MLTGTWVSQTISVMARLGVPDVLAGGPQPVSQIAAEVDADPSTLLPLLRPLTDLGVLVQDEEATFALTPLEELLGSDVPGSMRGGAIVIGLPFARHAWTDLYTSVRTWSTAPRCSTRQRSCIWPASPSAANWSKQTSPPMSPPR
jgi:hypothetical protein